MVSGTFLPILGMFLLAFPVRVIALCNLRDGRIVSGSKDRTLRIWDAVSRDYEQFLSGHKDNVDEVLTLSDGRLLSSDRFAQCLLGSPVENGEGGGFRSVSVSVSLDEFRRLKQRATSFNGGVVGLVNSSYSVRANHSVESSSWMKRCSGW